MENKPHHINGKGLGVAGKLADSINNIVGKNLLDRNGKPMYTQKITGYVCGVHGQDDEDESLRGTIDVQEFNCMQELYEDYDEETPIGYHEGVYVSAIQNNQSGFLIMPQMFSEVTIVQDPHTRKEYVIAFSHVDIIQLDSHQSVKVGVTETKDFDEDDDESPDFDELELTGKAVHTEYTPDKLIESATINNNGEGGEVEAKEGNYRREVTNKDTRTNISDSFEEYADAKHKTVKVGNTTISIDGENGSVQLNINGTTLSIDKKGEKVAIGGSDSSQISVDSGGNVVLGQGADYAVTWTQLNSVLSNLCSLLSSALVATQLGPQPLSTAGAIGSLPGQFQSFKSTKVKLAK